MIYTISGKLTKKGPNLIVVEVGGLGFKVFANERTIKNLPVVGSDISLFSFLYLREQGPELYGFLSAEELGLFELLNTISGVGPKVAISILDIADLKSLAAAIKEGRPDLLTRASGVGRKTAERIVLELRNKVQSEMSEIAVKKMESDVDLAETLIGLGYRRDEAKSALAKVEDGVVNIEDRLKAALRILSGKRP
ncbi:MAG: Holliday junction branch migration protein RuvA [Patescibacteria group bacterium]